ENLEPFKAVILSGSPFSVRAEDAPHPDLSKIRGYKPLLAVCYGAQYLAHFNGGSVEPSNIREYGRAKLSMIKSGEDFFKNIPENAHVHMSHSDTIAQLHENGVRLASSIDVLNSAYRIEGEETYAIQFHPAVSHTTHGKLLLENFLVNTANVEQSWTPAAFVETTVE